MMRRVIDDAATVLTLLRRSGRPISLSALLSGWDLLEADIPARERVEAACSILVGTGLAEVSEDWGVSVTQKGERIRRAVNKWTGMRIVRAEIADRLAQHDLVRSPVKLAPDVFDRAVEARDGGGGPRRGGSARWWCLPKRRSRRNE